MSRSRTATALLPLLLVLTACVPPDGRGGGQGTPETPAGAAPGAEATAGPAAAGPAAAQEAPIAPLAIALEGRMTGERRVLYYHPGADYQIWLTPGRVTTIILQDDETLVSAAAGDTERFEVEPTTSDNRAVVFVKALEWGVRTNLVIVTDRRVYSTTLRVGGERRMSRVVAFVAYDATERAGYDTRRREAVVYASFAATRAGAVLRRAAAGGAARPRRLRLGPDGGFVVGNLRCRYVADGAGRAGTQGGDHAGEDARRRRPLCPR